MMMQLKPKGSQKVIALESTRFIFLFLSYSLINFLLLPIRLFFFYGDDQYQYQYQLLLNFLREKNGFFEFSYHR